MVFIEYNHYYYSVIVYIREAITAANARPPTTKEAGWEEIASLEGLDFADWTAAKVLLAWAIADLASLWYWVGNAPIATDA
jgi:hypothetical protein